MDNERFILNMPPIHRGPSIDDLAWRMIAATARGHSLAIVSYDQARAEAVERRVKELLEEMDQ
jgi:PIN domain nuclease of toxin-antitoxin system